MTAVTDTFEPALPFDDRRHLRPHHFLVEEAAMLDAGDWARVARRCSPTTSAT